MVPSASALSKTALSPATDFSISPHCVRGICQLAMYEYIGGFSFTSEACAPDGRAQLDDSTSTHAPTKTLHDLLLMVLLISWLGFGQRGSADTLTAASVQETQVQSGEF